MPKDKCQAFDPRCSVRLMYSVALTGAAEGEGMERMGEVSVVERNLRENDFFARLLFFTSSVYAYARKITSSYLGMVLFF